MKLLLVEDNKSIAKGLTYTLTSNGYEVTLCDCFEEALRHSGEDYAVMIIDVTLPDGSGFELYETIRRYNHAPAVFLTAMDDEDSIVRGFDLGAEDYITKPFSNRELLARLSRIIRRSRTIGNTITAGDITLNPDTLTVTKNDAPVEMTALEFRILSMLMQNLGKTVTREIILEKIWDISGNYVNDNTLSVYIKRIRRKLDTDLIKTIKGIGYRMEEK